MSPDSPLYMHLAESLATGGGAADPARTPGYPLFLAPFIWMFGSAWPLAAISAQQMLVVATGLITFRTTRLLFNSQPVLPLIALTFVLVEPNLWAHSYLILTETLFTFLVSCIALSIVEIVRLPRSSWTLVLFGFVCAAAYVRPIALYLPWALMATLTLYLVFRKEVRVIATCVLGAVLAWSATQIRVTQNLTLFDVPAFTTASSQLVYEWYGTSVIARAENRDWNDVRRELVAPMANMTPGEKVIFEREHGKKILLQYPLVSLVVWGRGFITNLLDPGTGIFANLFGIRSPNSGLLGRFHSMSTFAFVEYLLREEGPLVALLLVGGIFLAGQYAGLATGIAKNWQRPVVGLIFVVVLYLLVLSSGPQSMARFRVPCVPLFGPFVAHGLWVICKWATGRLSKRATEAPIS